MSETSFASSKLDLYDTPPPMSLLEIRLRDLLRAIRFQVSSALSIERPITVPGLIGEETPLAIQFDASNAANIPEAYITHINPTNGGRLFFIIPKDWTGIAPSGNLSIETAVVLLEHFHHTVLHPIAPVLHFGQQLASGIRERRQDLYLASDDAPTEPAFGQTPRLS